MSGRITCEIVLVEIDINGYFESIIFVFNVRISVGIHHKLLIGCESLRVSDDLIPILYISFIAYVLNLRAPHFRSGNFNDNLEYEDGQLLLVYSDGKKSCNGGNNRTTTIIFTCHHEQRGSNGPQFLQSQSTDCSFYFEWPTALACLPFEYGQ